MSEGELAFRGAEYRVLTEQDLQRILRERGYLVAWSQVPWKIGSVLRPWDVFSEQRFAVVAQTDKRDHDEQLRLIGEVPIPESSCAYFYRLVTD